jgi:uncharacterized protein YhbP (UPF0306 family)
VAKELSEMITAYISKCPTCIIATASQDGEPSASTVYFSNKSLDLFFNTLRDSQKVRNISVNPRVAIVFQDTSAASNDREIKGVQYSGKAEILAQDELDGVPGPVKARNNAFNSVKVGNSVIVKVSPSKIFYIDYSKGFRHREEIQFG